MGKTMDDKYREYLKSERWARKRQAILKRDRHKCRAC